MNMCVYVDVFCLCGIVVGCDVDARTHARTIGGSWARCTSRIDPTHIL